MSELTQPQFDALAQLLRLREGSAAREAARLQLVDGLSIGDAAAQLGIPYKDAQGAVKRARTGLGLARLAAGAD